MSDKIKVSVIMPSLNVGEYIEECILSVINQTLKEIEIICIDAGSTDGTLDILEKYAEKDSRITILNSTEKSYGHQVNMGLSKAKGEYISIIETDDFIEEDMLESLYKLSDNATVDIIKGTFYHHSDYDKDNIESKIDNAKSKLPTSKKFTLKEYPLFIEGHPSIWAGIYRRDFLKDNNISVVEAPAGGWVDNPFFYDTAIAAKSIVYTHKPFYYYRVSNPNSSSNNLGDFAIPMNRILEMFDILEKNNCDDENILVMFYNRLFRYIEIILENNNNTDKDLDYETCVKIHEVVKKVDARIVTEKLKFNFQKIYYKYVSPLFLARFDKPSKLSDEDYEILFKENEFLHTNVAHFRTQFNETNYRLSQLEKKYEELSANQLHIDVKHKTEKPINSIKPKQTKAKITHRAEPKQKIYSEIKESEYTVSVIMPVFNGAQFLERSMASLLKQTLDNFEIVFIDDGSTDDSLEILRNYEREYDFVTVLTQENSGSGKARNYGINEAKGEYIAFLDADDFFLDDDALEKMYDIGVSNDADMITANIKHDLANEGNFVPFGPFHYYRANTVILPEQYGIPWSFYKNIFKKEFLVQNNIYFPDLLRGQDPVFLAEALTKVDKIYVAATDLYAYVYNSDTAKASNPRKLYDQLLHYRQVIDYLDIPKFSRRREEYFVKIILFCSRLDDDNVTDAIEYIREIFKDMPEFLRRLENYIYLKFRHVDEVEELIPWRKISVIMELRNSNKFVEDSIMSILNQKYDDFELILINEEKDEKYYQLKNIFKNETWVKFIESDGSIACLRNIALNEASGEYVYFCNDDYVYENNLLETALERVLVTNSEVCLTNLPKDIPNSYREVNFKSILGNQNFPFYSCNYKNIIPHILSSKYELTFGFYKKSLLSELSFGDYINNASVFQIKSIINSNRITFIPEVLAIPLKKNNIYYRGVLPNDIDESMTIFDACADLEEFLKEKSVYDDLKTYFDIYKINQISSFLDYVRFVGSYSYNDPENRDLYANNDKVLDYSQYYGSKSEYVGLNYTYANEYYTKTKYEFNDLGYRDLKFIELNNNHFSNNTSLNKYNSVLKSDSYEEYMEMENFTEVDKLHSENKKLKQDIENAKFRKEKITQENEEKNKQNKKIKKELENEIKTLEEKNKKLVDENNQLKDEYWKNREEYDYITSSRSWKYTKWMRNE